MEAQRLALWVEHVQAAQHGLLQLQALLEGGRARRLPARAAPDFATA